MVAPDGGKAAAIVRRLNRPSNVCVNFSTLYVNLCTRMCEKKCIFALEKIIIAKKTPIFTL